MRTSSSFVKQWTKFLVGVDTPVEPVLFQHLTDVVFITLVENHFKLEYLEPESDDVPTSDENNVVRYIAGYVCRHLRDCLEQENHELKEEMILCLMELTREKAEGDAIAETEEWTRKMDRVGLWYVKETTSQLFYAIELQVQPCLKSLKMSTHPCKSDMIRRIVNDDDIQFYWLIASADFKTDDAETKDRLLNKIVQLFVIVREFSLAGVTMEQHKQDSKKVPNELKV